MVDHSQKGVKTIRKRKVGDEITGDLLEGAGAGRWNGKEGRPRWMHVDLVLLTRSASSDTTTNVRGEARPPNVTHSVVKDFLGSAKTRWAILTKRLTSFRA